MNFIQVKINERWDNIDFDEKINLLAKNLDMHFVKQDWRGTKHKYSCLIYNFEEQQEFLTIIPEAESITVAIVDKNACSISHKYIRVARTDEFLLVKLQISIFDQVERICKELLEKYVNGMDSKKVKNMVVTPYQKHREQPNNELKQLGDQISTYLELGGLFNPECMEHDKVRDLLIKIRETINNQQG
jgi:guanylate kinase